MGSAMISSCALYFVPDPDGGIARESIDSVSDFLAERGLFPIHCEYGPADAESGTSVDLRGGTREPSETVAPGSGVVAIHYGPRDRAAGTDPWAAKFNYYAEWGCAFLGIDSRFSPPGAELARRLFRAVDPHVGVGYGYGYTLPQESGPLQYALGIGYRASADEPSPEFKRLNNLWSREVTGKHRYLSGYVRQVYPVNVLSQPHLDWGGGSITALGIGELIALERDRWLWLVPESRIPEASEYLARHNRLICV
jgi:hypothetical protein